MFIYSQVQGHVCCFRFLAIINKPSMNIVEQTSLWYDRTSFRQMYAHEWDTWVLRQINTVPCFHQFSKGNMSTRRNSYLTSVTMKQLYLSKCFATEQTQEAFLHATKRINNELYFSISSIYYYIKKLQLIEQNMHFVFANYLNKS